MEIQKPHRRVLRMIVMRISENNRKVFMVKMSFLSSNVFLMGLFPNENPLNDRKGKNPFSRHLVVQ